MARGHDFKLDRLAKVSLFSGCSNKELQRIAAVADEVTIDAGRVIVKEGTHAYDCFVVVEGEAVVEVGGKQVATIGAGETIGEMGLLDRKPRTATVTAKTPVTAYVIDGQRFDALLEDAPSVARSILGELSSRLRETDAARW